MSSVFTSSKSQKSTEQGEGWMCVCVIKSSTYQLHFGVLTSKKNRLCCSATIQSVSIRKGPMKNICFLFLALVVTHSFSWGSVVELQGNPTDIDVSGTPMKVFPQATLTTPKGNTNLKLTGYGIRQKAVAFVHVNVYLATSYVDESINLNNSSPVDSLKDAKGRVILLDMLRTMTAQDIRTAFEEALDVNGVDVNSKEVQSLFSQFTGDLHAGDRIVVASYPTGEGTVETLILELPKKTLTESGNLLGLDFLKIWFGEPVDELMGELKAKLTGASKP